jgi:hypothetical protein
MNYLLARDVINDLRARLIEIYAEIPQYVSGSTFPLLDQAQEQMLRSDELMAQHPPFFFCQMNYLCKLRHHGGFACMW